MNHNQASVNSNTQEDFDEITQQIRVLQSSQDELSRSIRNLQVRAARIQNQKAAVSRIPSDVLSMIFEECRQLNPQWSGILFLLHQSPVEVRLSHVSSHWREVALTSPSLWSSIHYPFSHKEDSLMEYLKRSDGSLLDVYIGPWRQHPQIEHVLTNIILPHLPRFRQLVLDAVSREALASLLATFRNVSAPALTRLRVMCRGPMSTAGPIASAKLFTKGAPLLSDVRLDSVAVILPKTEAKTLHFCPPPGPPFPLTREKLFRAMSAFPFLRRLHVKSAIELNNVAPIPPILLPSLRELVVHGLAVSTGIRIFDVISTPNIESLYLVDMNCSAISAIHRFMTQSYPDAFQSLQVLRYIKCEFSEDMDIHFLRATPGVSQLLVPVDKTNYLIRMLVNSDKQAAIHGCPPLWPELRTVTLHTHEYCAQVVGAGGVPDDEPSPTMNLLQELVTGRKVLGRPLSKLSFKGPNAGPFSNEFHWGLNRAKEFISTEVVSCQITALLYDGGQEYDWAVVAEAYGMQLRQFLQQVQGIRQQLATILPPNFSFQQLRRRVDAPA
ncbi:uncharacterized protein F5891DRAFT_683982 [Suillus fuscotomentosus]|uniref:F-box domain-containing protein n=1 Tax=Suillus fuscotomentosus TaxID=1912939 RepID=A0AAD4EFH6_9AGAM|nr:uncharacterized protein F5891DRAFT_683982 [Suillus fuscotomentosus]KAG1905305.1 hypothetical protein F5891DRAFT_683982 [Suillus fuscotomentosus]